MQLVTSSAVVPPNWNAGWNDAICENSAQIQRVDQRVGLFQKIVEVRKSGKHAGAMAVWCLAFRGYFNKVFQLAGQLLQQLRAFRRRTHPWWICPLPCTFGKGAQVRPITARSSQRTVSPPPPMQQAGDS